MVYTDNEKSTSKGEKAGLLGSKVISYYESNFILESSMGFHMQTTTEKKMEIKQPRHTDCGEAESAASWKQGDRVGSSSPMKK